MSKFKAMFAGIVFFFLVLAGYNYVEGATPPAEVVCEGPDRENYMSQMEATYGAMGLKNTEYHDEQFVLGVVDRYQKLAGPLSDPDVDNLIVYKLPDRPWLFVFFKGACGKFYTTVGDSVKEYLLGKGA